MDIGSLTVAALALVVALLSLYFSKKSWRESNRPLVTARVSSLGMGGNVSIPLSLVVENTGNRPAKNITLKVDKETLESILICDRSDTLRAQVEECFSEDGVIPVLANGKAISNSFGVLTDESNCTWKARSRFEIEVLYQDLDGRKFQHRNPLYIAEDSGFASGFWELSAQNSKAGQR